MRKIDKFIAFADRGKHDKIDIEPAVVSSKVEKKMAVC